jgi:nucleoside-diphosphate-sugar epimerase
MSVLVTGATGFLGSALIPQLLAKGDKVIALVRDKEKAKRLLPQEVKVVEGDIIKPNLGIENVPKDVKAVIHCAALLSFSSKDKDRLYEVNYRGTFNLLEWMRQNKIRRLFHISTAYLFNQNHYEISKQMAEEVINHYLEIKTTIFRPSIIIADSKLQGLPPLSGFYLGIKAIDQTKRWFESRTSLPPLRVKVRLKANPNNKLNLIPIDIVSESIVKVVGEDKGGIFYLCHPDPPTLKSLEKPISNAVGADIEVNRDFEPNIVDRLASLLMKGLSPYLLREYNLPSDIDCPPLTHEFLAETIKRFLNHYPPRSLV